MADPGGNLTASIHDTLYAGVLMTAAAAAAWPPRAVQDRRRPVRLPSSLVVAAAVALPVPYALLVAVSALATSGGAGLAGALAPGVRGILVGFLGAIVAQAAGAALPPLAPLAAGAIVASAMTVTVLTLERALGARSAAFDEAAAAVVNVVAAALLVAAIRAGDLGMVAGSSALLVLAGHALHARARERARAEADRAALRARSAELTTLHAIGREVLATVDTERIFAIIERECRKIFEVAFFFIGVLDKDTNEIRITYRSATDDAQQQTVRPLANDLASWIVLAKRPVRVDDAALEANALPFRPHIVNDRTRSLLASPLLVGERVIGVLSVQSARPAAYDDHQLSVLSTIAQQAAVAVENARHHRSATIDSLTRLPLRDVFFHRVEDEHRRAKRYAGSFSLLMLDLDGFKKINDRYGHIAGDLYLRAVGTAIKARMRGADLACRYGGDEFCILLPATDLAGARQIAERLRQTIARLVVDVDGGTLRSTVSIGVASYPEHDTGETNALLLRADAALYQAKRAGRDRVVPYAA